MRDGSGPHETRQGADDLPQALRNELNELFTTAVDLHKRGHSQQAAALYQAIIGVDPGHDQALHLLGVIAHAAGEHARASELISRAIALNPEFAAAHFNLGVSLQALGRHADAAAAYRRALELEPGQRAALENLGVALQDLGDWEAAAEVYRRALTIDPSASIAHQNLGTLLGNMGQMREARRHFEHVLAVHPAYGDAHTKRAWTLLADGNFAEGWQEYEWRWLGDSFVANNPVRVVPFPRWDGAPLADKTILINPEQGIGDELMFATCYRDVISAARHCVIECDPRLVPLFARSFQDSTVIARAPSAHFVWTRVLPPIDVRVSAGSLPRFYRNSLADFPADTAYLRADGALVEKWRNHFASFGRQLTIGISWRGGREARSSAARSIPLTEWQEVLRFPYATFVNVQYGDHAAEIAAVERDTGIRLHSLPGVDPLRDLDDFSAAIAALDLVISIDNSTVFLAGAVGTPAWVFIPVIGEWRWLKERSTSPWFESLSLLRQSTPGIAGWRAVMQEAATGLHDIVARPRQAARPQSDQAADVPQRAAHRTAATEPATVFLNDSSSWYHFGCTCTSLAIHAALRERSESVVSVPIQTITQLTDLPTSVAGFHDDEQYARFRDRYPELIRTLAAARTIFVNGEGALHNVGQQARGLLYLLLIAKMRLHRPVHLINHSCYPDDGPAINDNGAFALYRAVYEPLDYVAVRERQSLELVRAMGIDAAASFDCLPLFVERYFTAPTDRPRQDVLVAGSVSWGGRDMIPVLADYVGRIAGAGFTPRVLIGADAYLAADDFHFVDAMQAVCGGRMELVRASSALEWLALIANAALLVSGRFHHTLAAAFVDTPFIAMDSNTPKIQSVLKMMGSEAFLSVTRPDLGDALYERSLQYVAHAGDLAVPEPVKANLRDLARQNFAGVRGI